MNPTTCWVVSAPRNIMPRHTPAQLTANENNRINPTTATTSPGPVWIRQPIARPVAATTVMPSTLVSRSATVRPASTVAPEMGSDLNRSMSPVSMSAAMPTAVPSMVAAALRPNTPAMRYSW